MDTKKTVLITGATSGLGLETAKVLALKGYDVLGTSRSTQKEREATQYIGKPITFVQTDLTSLKNQRALSTAAHQWLNGRGLDVLVNNAGTFYSHHSLSAEGLEKQFAVNTLAPLHLSLLLYDVLTQANGRIVNVSSNSHYGARIRWDDMQLSKHYNQLAAYKQTKMFSVMLSREFNKHSKMVKTYMADPGLVNTEMGFKNTSGLARLVWKQRRKSGQSVSAGAKTQVFLATAPTLNDFYYRDCKPKAPDKKALNSKFNEKIWEYATTIIGLDISTILK